jgi:hypothetical protein
VWVVLFAAALWGDESLSRAVHRSAAPAQADRTTAPRTARTSTVRPQDGAERNAAEPGANVLQNVPTWVRRLWRAPGHLAFTLCLAAFLVLRHPLRWKAGALLLTCAALGGVAVWAIKWAVGRTRPFHGVPPFEFHPFERGIPGLITNRNLCFPSGDATLAFATAACMGFLAPRSWPFFFVAAVVVGAERVVENAHYVSDVVGGAALGTLCVPLVRWLWQLAARRNAALALSPAEGADDADHPARLRTPGRSPGESRAGASA